MNTAAAEVRSETPAPPSKLSYNTAEARAVLGIGHTKLMELVREERIECVRLGKLNLFPAASLEAFVASLPKRSGGRQITKRAA